MSSIALIGVLRGGGDTRFVLLMDIIFMWTVSIPLGFVAGLALALPVPIVYAIIKGDEFFKTFFSVIRILRGKWINDITKTA
jgi:Na+-driven multidrug efflux pump